MTKPLSQQQNKANNRTSCTIKKNLQNLAGSSLEESEKLLSIMKKSLSGGIGLNLIDLEFSARQTMEGEEHKLLMALRSSCLKDENALEAFYQKV